MSGIQVNLVGRWHKVSGRPWGPRRAVGRSAGRWRTGRASVAAAIAVIAGVIAASPLVAQRAFQTPYLDRDHWTRGALARIHGLGLAPPGFDPATASLTVAEAAAALEFAAQRSPGAGAELAAGWLSRLHVEYPGLPWPGVGTGSPEAEGESARTPLRHLGGSALGGYDAASGRVRGGLGYWTHMWSGPRPVPDHASGRLALDWSGVVWPGLAVRLSPSLVGGSLPSPHWQVATRAGSLGVWAGRRDHRLGGGLGGTLVLSDVDHTAIGAHTARPLELPGLLGRVGPIRVETGLGRVEDNGVFGQPWLWYARLRVEPHPRFELAVNRAAMFGGEGNTPITLRHLLVTFYGDHSGEEGEFDNQVVAVEARYRLPIQAIPLVVLVEWGFEDSAGAWWDVPGRLIGVRAPALPGAPALGVGAEWTSFAPECCGNPKWYRNWTFLEGWTNAGRPMGHPLAGHGNELRLVGDWTSGGGGVQLETQAFGRDRGEENLFAPQRAGRSVGGSVRLDGVMTGGAGVLVDVEYERGAGGWQMVRLSAGGRWLF
jgi:hypothetical protein